MKKTLLFILLLGAILKVQGQTFLDITMDLMDVSMKIPKFLTVSQNDELIFVVENDSLPTYEQIYGDEPSYGDIAYMAMFGLIHSIVRFNEDCLLFVFAAGEAQIKYGGYNKLFNAPNSSLKPSLNSSYNRIKHDLRNVGKMGGATEEDIKVIDTMLKHYPETQAQELFNASLMVSYPVDLRGNIYEDKYTTCQSVVVDKRGLSIFFYFMMTDESAGRFDEFLDKLKGVVLV